MSDKPLSLKTQPITKERNKKAGLILPQRTRAFMKVSLPVAQLEIQAIERK